MATDRPVRGMGKGPDNGRGNGQGRPTLFDGLSVDSQKALSTLVDALRARLRQRIEVQLSRPVEPWRARAKVPLKPALRPASVPPPRATIPAAAMQEIPVPQAKAKDWKLPPEASVREAPPKWASAVERMGMEAVLDVGAKGGETSGEPLYATVGLDFGTSSTKIIVRFPEEPQSPAIAIPAPAHCCSGGNPYLWQTVVWVRHDGTFLPWPEPDACVIHTLKQGIVGDRPNAVVAPGYGKDPITRLDAATAYLAFVIRYAKGWLLKHRPERFRGRRPAWFVNVGLPAADYDNNRLIAQYRAAAATALVLAGSAEAINVETTRASAGNREVSAAAASAEDAEAIGIAVVPEVAAEVAGFMKSTAGASGLYVVVDVGALTLDVCAFNFKFRQVEGDLYPLLETDVQTLGVEAYHWFMNDQRTPEEFAKQCELMLWGVIWKTKRDRDPSAACWKPGNEVPIFLVGGGAANELHRETVEALDGWAKKYIRNNGIRLTGLTPPPNLEWPDADGVFDRMPVAWGLSYTPLEIGEIMPPSRIESIPRTEVRNYLGNFISKDDV